MSYIDVTGKTEEEAIRKALQQLQMTATMSLLRFWSGPRAAFWASAAALPGSA